MLFSDFGFEPQLMDGLSFDTPTAVQQQAIPVILSNKDLIACAQTGTGKTAAYVLPVINKIIKEHSSGTNTLIIVPTRELAIQIDEVIHGFTYFTSVGAIAVYGGNDGSMFEQEKRSFKEGVDIIIATPGRLLSHLGQSYLKFDKLKHLILDEADRMLDMGFIDDIMRIISYIPQQRQTLMFSATMNPKIRTLAKKLLHEPEEINISLSKPAEGVSQSAFVLYENQKTEVLKTFLLQKDITSILIFCSTKEKVKKLEIELRKIHIDAAAIHSDLEQLQRNEVLRRFANKKLQVLVATDILSRGIDIDSIGLVINFDLPGDAEDYIHRVGRTARADSKGMAVTFISEYDQRKFKKIEDLIGYAVEKLPVPPALGAVPDYNPSIEHKKKTFNRKSPKNNNFKRHSK